LDVNGVSAYLIYSSVGYFVGSKVLGEVTITDFLQSLHAVFALLLIEIQTRIYTRGVNRVDS
jgi:hypothetical protein